MSRPSPVTGRPGIRWIGRGKSRAESVVRNARMSMRATRRVREEFSYDIDDPYMTVATRRLSLKLQVNQIISKPGSRAGAACRTSGSDGGKHG
jgi:hypothetical protein